MEESPHLFKDEKEHSGDERRHRRPGRFLRNSMDRIRRSFRDSFRRRSSKDRGLTPNHGSTPSSSNDATRPQNWLQDEASVRAGTCNFNVKYLGCVEVFESRGMQVCEEALKVLKSQRRRPVRGMLYISGDGLRVVDADNKGLIVDQTIEKVSFCAPDRSNEKGFAYICRDGTTRRWMCHGFHANKETGERLSHAVGCAFAVCMEKKQKRDRTSCGSISEHTTPATATSTATATATATATHSISANAISNMIDRKSFRQASLSDRLLDPQNMIPAPEPPPVSSSSRQSIDPSKVIARPQPNPQLFERQGSLRMPTDDRFKRQQSLRIQDLPSTINRQAQMGVPGARVSAIAECPDNEVLEERSISARNSSSPNKISNGSTQRGQLSHANTIGGPPTGHWQDLDATPSPPQVIENESFRRSTLTMSGRGQQWLESTHQLLISASQVAQSRPYRSDLNALSPVAENGVATFDPHSCPPPPLPPSNVPPPTLPLSNVPPPPLPPSNVPPPLPPRITKVVESFESKWNSFDSSEEVNI